MPKTRPIEMYVGFSNGSDAGHWNTDVVEIPIDTPDDKIHDVAGAAMDKKLREEGVENAVFWGVYNISYPDDEAEEE